MGLSAVSVGLVVESGRGSISLLGLCLLGSSVRAGALGFVGSRNRICVCLVTSSRLVVSLRLCLCVFVNTAPLSSPSPVLSISSLVRSRFGSRNRVHGGVFSALGCCGVTRVPPPLAVRCALFSVDGRVGCFSCLNEIGRSFCGASPGSGPATPPTRRPETRNPRAMAGNHPR